MDTVTVDGEPDKASCRISKDLQTLPTISSFLVSCPSADRGEPSSTLASGTSVLIVMLCLRCLDAHPACLLGTFYLPPSPTTLRPMGSPWAAQPGSELTEEELSQPFLLCALGRCQASEAEGIPSQAPCQTPSPPAPPGSECLLTEGTPPASPCI
uniref:Uncharacterized protein n=1 Tax=Sphaerodactylus townsendi TaxID=933632 RepID=A0ACB8FNP2_9SAUR